MDRILGRLEEFKSGAIKSLEKIDLQMTALETKIDKRFDHIENEVSSLSQFRWKIIGGSIVASVMISAFFSIVSLYISNKQ